MASTSTQRIPIRRILISLATPALLAAAMTSLLPSRASAQAIFNQTTACGTETMPSQDYSDLGGEVMAADDFVVPGGQSWTLDRVAVFGALAEIVPSNPTYDVTIYNNAGAVPGTVACSYTGLTSNTVTVAPGVEAGFQFDFPSVCNLGSGTYWLEVQAIVPSSDAIFGWQSSTAGYGNVYVWRDPNNIFGTGCTDWTNHTLCGFFGGPNPDLCLALFEEGAILDLAPPFVTLELDPVHLDPLANGTLTATASETDTGAATVVSIEYQLDGGSWMPMTAFDGAYDSNDEAGVETVSFVAEGVHEACARATDGLGNTSPPTCIDIGVGAAGDITGPSTAISFGPIPIRALEEGALSATSSEVNTGGSTIADIEYQLDGGPWMSMEPFDDAYDSITEMGLERPSFATVGMHEACVRGMDSRGNTGEALCIDIEVIETDSQAPPPPMVDVQPNPVTDGNATLSVTASDATTGNSTIVLIEYRIDSGNWMSIIPPADGFYDEPTEEGEVDLEFSTSGTFSVCARATDDFNNTSNPGCVDVEVEASLRLRAIEVNQVIQNWRNEVPLYQKKDTVVRVFFEKIDPQAPNWANGLLHGSIGGAPLPGSPLATGARANAGDDATAFTLIDGPDADEDPDDAIDSYRGKLSNSLNFFLPASWIDQGGTVDLEFELTIPADGFLECAEPDGSPDCMVSVSFETIDRPIIEFFAVPYNRNERLRLELSDATGGTYTLTSGARMSDPIAWNASAADLEAAVEDVIGGLLDARDGRVVVFCWDGCGNDSPLNREFRITILRGQDEELLMDDSGLTGTGSAAITELQKGGPQIAPTDADLREQARRVSDVFPSLGVDYRLRRLNDYSQAPTLLKVNNRISKARKLDKALGRFTPGTNSFGLLMQRGPTSTKSGMAWLNVSSTYAQFAEDPEDGGTSRSTGMHEGSHTYGRAHAVVVNHGVLGSIGLCGSKYNQLISPFHPFVETTGIENLKAAEIDEAWRYDWPTIGPLSSGADDEIWGFSPRAYANGAGFRHLVIVDPRMSAELMSYCDPPGSQQDLWVSSFTYDKLRQRLGGGSGVETRGAEGLDPGDYLLISGWIDAETDEVELEPAIRLTGLEPGNDAGEVHVALVDGVGAEISAVDVALLVDGDHESLSFGVGPEHSAFVAAVPVPDGSNPAGYEVTLDAQMIAQFTASANPPTVAITSPTAGSLATEVIPIAWDAEDLDGDPLTASIFLSVDLGLTWQTLAVDVEASTYDAPTSYLEGSTSALVRVLVSDGFHSAEATSDAFELDAGKPLVDIEIPINGVAVPADEILHLRGAAWDPEDGLLEGGELAWSVDDGGGPVPLGSGSDLDLPASQFATGCQTITLEATDSSANTATDTVEVDIGETGCLGLFFADGFESGDLGAWSGSAP